MGIQSGGGGTRPSRILAEVSVRVRRVLAEGSLASFEGSVEPQ